MLKEAKDVLDWANKEYLNNNWPHGDYKELVELLIIYLGGKIYNFKFRITGADHHARWMSKIIYCLKISLLINQYKLDDESKAKLLECAKFQSIIYCKYWFMGFNLICRLNLFAKKKLQTNQNISNLIC